MYTRPYIDIHNLDNNRLKKEEYKKALDYTKELILGVTRNIISDQEELEEEALKKRLSDSDLLEVFKASREAYSFLGTLPEKDIVAIMREVFFGGLEKELGE